MLAITFPFAADDLCAVNLQTIAIAIAIAIANAKAQLQAPGIQARVEASVQQAKAHQVLGTKEGTEKCIAETTQTIQDIQDAMKGGKG